MARSSGNRRRPWLRRKSVARLLALLVASAAASSCAPSRIVLLAPEPCEAPSQEQIDDLARMIERGEYPGVEEILSAYEIHCREDDALSDRPPRLTRSERSWLGRLLRWPGR